MSYPSGETVHSTYLPQGALESLYSSGWEAPYVQSSQYDAAGRLVASLFGNGIESEYTYYPWAGQGGRLQELASATVATPPQTRQDLTYLYDANGNITSLTDGVASESLSFAYDGLDRLDLVNGAYTDDLAYDARGNLSQKGGVTLTYPTGSEAAHPHGVISAGGNSYSYDANGNMTQRIVGGVTYPLVYDAENRLVGISSSSGLSAVYTYDGDGQRVKSVVTVQAETTTTGYVGDYFEISVGTPKEIHPYNPPDCSGGNYCMFFPIIMGGVTIPEGHAWLSYFYAGSQRVGLRVQSNQQEQESGLYYFLTDHLSSTTLTLDGSGAKVSELRYNAWVETRYSDGTTPTSFRYTGQRQDSYINLYWYGSRWYDDSLGRFIQPDVIVPDQYNLLDWDRFSYARNNPVRYNDPTGHWVETALDVAFIFYDVYDIQTNGLTWISGLSLAADVIGAVLPVVTGGGLAIRAAVQAGKAADKAIDAGEIVSKADDIADVVSHGDDLADALNHIDDLPDDAFVCRGGSCTADRFATGSGVTISPDGTLSGVSVNSAVGISVEELTSIGIPHQQVGVTTVGDVRTAGGNVISSPTLNNLYHSALSGITPKQAEKLFTPTRRNPNYDRIR